MTDYTNLRAALDQTCHALLIDDPDTIRALLAERDAYFFALQEISHPEGTRASATQIARAALAQGEA